ncbi:MAG: GNAT family N-acetyltransferase [Candidatus Moraniibacteriota bacterium]
MNKIIDTINHFTVVRLDKDFAKKHIDILITLASQIPLVSYDAENILADSKKGRKFIGKWIHSLAVMDGDKAIACIFAYERKAELSGYYSRNFLYISELAVDKQYQGQGIAKKLVTIFLEKNKTFKFLDGKIQYAVQTNEAPWNHNVHKLYLSLGFKQTGEKAYDNRTDMIFTKN